MSIQDDVARADLLREQLIEQRNRIVREAVGLGLITVTGGVVAVLAGTDDRALSTVSLVESINRWVFDRYPRVKAEALAGDAAAAARLKDATSRILVAAGGTSALSDTTTDVKEFIDGVSNDAKVAGAGIGLAVAIGLGIYAATRR